jgi:hypothetical protein
LLHVTDRKVTCNNEVTEKINPHACCDGVTDKNKYGIASAEIILDLIKCKTIFKKGIYP